MDPDVLHSGVKWARGNASNCKVTGEDEIAEP